MADDTRVILALRRLRTLACVVVVLALAVPAATATATATATDGGLDGQAAAAHAQARAAGIAVARLTEQVRAAQGAYGQAVASVGTRAVVTWNAAERVRSLEQSVAQASAQRAGTARSLYMGGGGQGLASSLLDAGDPADLAGRLVAVRWVLERASQDEAQAAATIGRAQRAVAAADAAGSRAVVTVDLVATRAAHLADLLATAQHRLDALSARSRALAEAQAAARELAAARAAVAAQQQQLVRSVTAVTPPADLFALYHAAALTCPGMPWQLLAAVGQVESGHGRNNGPSSAGAIGPMQFMPSTFAAYAVDGDGDGRLDPWSPADSVYTSARYLCASGGGSPAGFQRALLTYNHAQWYVDLVLGVMRQL